MRKKREQNRQQERGTERNETDDEPGLKSTISFISLSSCSSILITFMGITSLDSVTAATVATPEF